MSVEDDLLRLAREREDKTESDLRGMLLEQPDRLRRQLREYLARQTDHGRMSRMDEKFPQMETIPKGFNLVCPKAEFSSGARLEFEIQLERERRGWLVTYFQFHVHLPRERSVKMVRIHLNHDSSRDPLLVPRCHIHIGDSKAHVPFPIMDPRLILHLICEQVERDFGV